MKPLCVVGMPPPHVPRPRDGAAQAAHYAPPARLGGEDRRHRRPLRVSQRLQVPREASGFSRPPHWQAKRVAWRSGDRLIVAAFSGCLPRPAWHVLPVRPETLLRWHRDLVRRRWVAFGRRRGPGRPPVPQDVVDLVVRLARENPRWGYQRITGELLKVGYRVSPTAVRSILRRHRVPPAQRRAGLAWPAFLRAHARGFLAVDTVRLHVLYALFFVEVQTRRVLVAGCIAHPTRDWVVQQARNLCWDLEREGIRPTIFLRDRNTTFAPAFDAVFATQGTRVVRTPVRAPRGNALAERWVRTVREDCLNWLLVLGERHLRQVLREYVGHYNSGRPHRARGLRPPLPRGQPPAPAGEVVRRDRLGGLIHECERTAA
jgi:putative transposase